MQKNLITVRGLTEIIDPYYRYKMEPVNVIQQKGKLLVTNITDIAKNLSTDKNSANVKTKMIIEFFKTKFSTSITYKDINKLEIKGVTRDDLQNAVYEFIEYFVLCPSCQNPETLLFKENSNIYMKCQACSHNDKLKSNKMVMKLWDCYAKLLNE